VRGLVGGARDRAPLEREERVGRVERERVEDERRDRVVVLEHHARPALTGRARAAGDKGAQAAKGQATEVRRRRLVVAVLAALLAAVVDHDGRVGAEDVDGAEVVDERAAIELKGKAQASGRNARNWRRARGVGCAGGRPRPAPRRERRAESLRRGAIAALKIGRGRVERGEVTADRIGRVDLDRVDGAPAGQRLGNADAEEERERDRGKLAMHCVFKWKFVTKSLGRMVTQNDGLFLDFFWTFSGPFLARKMPKRPPPSKLHITCDRM
jgi:hypothetical protein